MKLAKDLTEAGRDRIKEKNFAIPEGRRYPIHDAAHARNALSRVDQHGTPEERNMVYSAVAEKYPGLAARSEVPGVRAALDKDGCGSCKAASMREELLGILKTGGVLQRLGEMANPATHLGEHAYDVGGLGILAAPVVDKLQAMARARLAGDSASDAVRKRQLFSEPVGEAMELGGLGVLAVPGALNLAKGLRR